MTSALTKCLRPTYATIDMQRLAHNIEVARQYSGSDIIAVIKAGAYGHGAMQVAHYAYENCNVRNFAVATISEGFALCEAFGRDKARILVFGYVDSAFYKDVTDNGLLLTIFDENIASAYHAYLEESGRTAEIVLKVDTGMSRLGFDPSLNLQDFAERHPRFTISHVMSHLSSSDDDPEYTTWQEGRFKEFLKQPHSLRFDTSLFNSSAIANFKNSFSLTRPGLFMYGYVSGAVQPPVKPVMKILSKVVHVQQLRKGQSVSYNKTFVADKDCWAGVVPVGYADGYSRRLSNKADMLVDGVRCRVLGNVCMDMTVIDLSAFGESAYGKEVEVMGDEISAKEISKLTGSIEYEFLCGISDRIPRIYI